MRNDIAWKLQVKFPFLAAIVTEDEDEEKLLKKKEATKYTCYHFAIIAMGNLYFYDLMNTLLQLQFTACTKQQIFSSPWFLIIPPHQNVTFNLNNNFSFRSQKRK